MKQVGYLMVNLIIGVSFGAMRLLCYFFTYDFRFLINPIRLVHNGGLARLCGMV